MKKQLSIVVCCSLSTVMSGTLAADSFSINPRVEVGYQDYRLETKGGIFGVKFKDKYQINPAILRLGVTGAWNRVYLDGYYQISNKDADTFDITQIQYSEEIDGDRTEYAATLGYNVFDSLAVFIGYRHAKADGSGNLGADYEFETDAFFVGGAYSMQVSENGVLSLNLAYADVYDADQEVDGPIIANLDMSGDGDGVKAGVSWRGALSTEWSYLLAADWYRYDHDLDGSAAGQSVDADLEETEVSFRIGLAYAF